MSGTISTTSPTTGTNDGERAVRDLLDRLYAAWTANDADAFAAHYVEDATVVMPGVFNRGRSAIRDFMAAGFAGPLRGSRGIDEPKAIHAHGDDTIVVVSEAGILMAGESAIPADRMVRATWLFTRQGGDWKVAGYHNCALR